MASAILIENGAGKAAMQRALEAMKNAGCSEGIIIAQQMPEDMNPGHSFISLASNSLAEAIQQAVARSSADTLLFLDARTQLTSSAITSLTQELASSNAGIAYTAIETSEETLSLGDVSADSLVTILGSSSRLPLALTGVRKSIADAAGRLEGESMVEVMAQIMVEAVNEGEAITQTAQTYSTTNMEEASTISALSDAARARCLRRAVELLNIEDMFPHHAWAAHREESAAASYHTLAAIFVRLGDSDTALECLSLGDQFEDSPRSLALKGLIALDKGQTLAAVANMVSSLQQYEARKKQNAQHYVHFAPRDLAGINTSLNAGLEALNKKDNDTALEHFASAVFSFDPFFGELGVANLKH